MRWFERWLKKEACGRKLCAYISGFLIVKLAYAFSVLEVAYLLDVDIPVVNKGGVPVSPGYFAFLLFFVVLNEEFVYRLPLAIVVERGWSFAKVLGAALVLSVAFGLIHGSVHHIFIQGVGGIIYSILFLKSGGLQGNYTKAIASTITVHYLFDAILFGIAFAGGATLSF